MLLNDLREQTRPYHQELERQPLLHKLLGPLTNNEFISILKGFYGFYKPLEDKFMAQQLVELQKFFFPKSQLIESDLNKMGYSLQDAQLCTHLPKLEENYHWLGVFYTLEGSCHGRKFLWPKIQKHLQLSQESSFFLERSHDLKEHWKNFCDNMCLQVQGEQEKIALIQGSISTFQSLKAWFDKI